MTPADYPHPPSYIGDALLFYKIAKSGQHFHQARDAPGEQALQLFASRRTRLPEDRFALSVLIDAVEHETMHMDIEIGCRTKSLYRRDSASVGCCAFQPRLLEHKPRDDTVDDAQHRREQFGVRREQNAQRGSCPGLTIGLYLSPLS